MCVSVFYTRICATHLCLCCEGALPLEGKSPPALLLSVNFLSCLIWSLPFFSDQKQTLNVLKYTRSAFHLFKVFKLIDFIFKAALVIKSPSAGAEVVAMQA